MICMNYDNNKKFGLLQFHSGYGNFYLNSPKDFSWKNNWRADWLSQEQDDRNGRSFREVAKSDKKS